MGHAYFHDIEMLAKFCAELTRQSIAFTVRECLSGWKVEMTGF